MLDMLVKSENTAALKLSRWFLRLAVAYILIGIGMGIYMGIHLDFTLMPAHAHVNLLGWVSSAIFALVYRLAPHMAEGKWPWAHLWVYNIGLVVMFISLCLFLLGYGQAHPVLGTSSFMILAGVCIFGKIVYSKF